VPVAYLTHDLALVAAARLAITVLFVPTLLLSAGRAVGVSAASQAAMLWRPVLAAGAMALGIEGVNSVLAVGGPLRLAIDIIAGSLIFAGTILAAWQIAGRPHSPEADVTSLLSGTLRRVMA
jgi:hypothetical protein